MHGDLCRTVGEFCQREARRAKSDPGRQAHPHRPLQTSPSLFQCRASANIFIKPVVTEGIRNRGLIAITVGVCVCVCVCVCVRVRVCVRVLVVVCGVCVCVSVCLSVCLCTTSWGNCRVCTYVLHGWCRLCCLSMVTPAPLLASWPRRASECFGPRAFLAPSFLLNWTLSRWANPPPLRGQSLPLTKSYLHPFAL